MGLLEFYGLAEEGHEAAGGHQWGSGVAGGPIKDLRTPPFRVIYLWPHFKLRFHELLKLWNKI